MLKLVLLCIWGLPESGELASVTSELAPILGPEEFAVLLRVPWFLSPEAGPRLDQAVLDIKLAGAGLCAPPWKKISDAEEEQEGAAPTGSLDGATEAPAANWRTESK